MLVIRGFKSMLVIRGFKGMLVIRGFKSMLVIRGFKSMLVIRGFKSMLVIRVFFQRTSKEANYETPQRFSQARCCAIWVAQLNLSGFVRHVAWNSPIRYKDYGRYVC